MSDMSLDVQSTDTQATVGPAGRSAGRSPLRWLWLLLLLVGVGLAWLRWGDPEPWLDGAPDWVRSTASLVHPAEGGSAPAKSRGNGPVPVRVAQVTLRDVPIEFRSVGTVEAVESTQIRARVDGVVERILVQDGASVQAGDVLVQLDGAPVQAQIDEQRANVRRARAQLENARLTLERSTDLAKRGATSKQALDDARTSSETLAAELAASEALLRSLQLQQSYNRVTAPFDGRIGRVGVSLGTIVRASDPAGTIATINQISPIYVSVGVPQNLLGDLAAADRAGTARIEVPLPGSTDTRNGPISMVENAVERGTGLVTVRARLTNDDQRLWPGTVLDAHLILRDEPGALVVPTDAIQISQSGSFLFVIDHDKARTVPIEVGRNAGDFTQLLSGPPAGTTVVVDGQLRLTEGSSVTIEESVPGLEAKR